ncbi:SufS family cysteine desulfurase [Neptunomonas antarctica]|uniref:cysteine desulfurase n=1 Tax=Neptunomonas antarctica TaxID=619304 RepID=A0A1N7JXU3_9GAMM|nr:SufS family cysteine desulfurase [Neptunomonas antarctica]SIS54150.1 cysteine desulfurase / selenocysteine lyase [Neptunomonas antarctica]
MLNPVKGFDPSKIRRDFPILSSKINGQPLIYLDNAATTHKPRCVIDALSRFYKLNNSNVHRGSHTLSNRATSEFEAARETVAQFINATDTAEIIWTRGATEGINLIAQSYADSVLCAGDTVLVSMMEHHANIVPWQQIADKKQAQVLPIPLTQKGELDLVAYKNLLNKHHPKIVSITHVSNAMGIINPVIEITHLAKMVGATVIIDGAQAAAHEVVDVQKIGCDFYVFSGHKCYGPTGIGVLWGRKVLMEAMPPWQSGGEMIEKVSFSGSTFNRLPFKFEAGTPPIADAIAMAEALRYLDSLDRAAISAHEKQLRQLASTLCQKIDGLTILAAEPENVGILSFTVAGVHHQDLATLLDQSGIAIRSGHHCTMPLMAYLGCDGTVRASFALYNTATEVERFAEVLQQSIAQLLNVNLTPAVDLRATDLKSSITYFEPTDDLQLISRLQSAKNWQARFDTLLSAGNYLPELPAAYKSQQNKVSGCESNVWLIAAQQPDHSWKFAADSDARLMRGIICLLLSVIQNKTRENLQLIDTQQLLESCDLYHYLGPSRTNGVQAIVDTIKQLTLQGE